MIAVLEDAVNVYLKHAGAPERHRQELFRDAEAWIESREGGWLYSFENICTMLGFEAEYIRRGLHASRERANGRDEPAVTLRTDPEEQLRSTGA